MALGLKCGCSEEIQVSNETELTAGHAAAPRSPKYNAVTVLFLGPYAV